MLSHQIRRISLFLLLSIGTAASTPAHLVLGLHEMNASKQELPTNPFAGGTTEHVASAIANEVGIIILSAKIWHNLHQRRLTFSGQSRKPGAPEHAIALRYAHLKAEPTSMHAAALQDALAQKEGSALMLLLWQLPLTADAWLAYHHEPTNLFILVPKNYLALRHMVSGLREETLTPITLPSLDQVKEYQTLVDAAATAASKSSRFTVPLFSQLFSTDEQSALSWSVYMNGHGFVPEEDEDSDTLLHDRWTLPILPRHNLHDAKTQAQLAARRYISGIPLTAFQELLLFLNTQLPTNVVFYQSCFGSGQNMPIIHRSTAEKLSGLHLTYPLIAGALTDNEVRRAIPQPTTKGWHYPQNPAAFFSHTTAPITTMEQVHRLVQAVTPTRGYQNDPHAISATPMVLMPTATEFVPVDVVRDATEALDSTPSKNPGLFVITERLSKNSAPLTITNTRALLIIPAHITTPLHVHPYAHTNHQIRKNLRLLPPAFISLPPGDAIHHIDSLTLHEIGLQAFLMHSLLHLKGQKAAKAFLIDELTVTNDLATTFTPTAGRSLLGLFGSSAPALNLPATPTITLRNVVLYTTRNRLQAYFQYTAADGTPFAGHTNYRSSQAPELLQKEITHAPMVLQLIPIATHEKLYAHYRAQLPKTP